MINRDYKEFAPLSFYHIYNRGVGKMDIFNDIEDYKMFLSRLEENIFPERNEKAILSRSDKKRKVLPSNSFNIISYCLMPNHFHLLIQQLTDLPISKLVSKVCTSYSMNFNKKYDRVGTLFQDQFKAVLIENNEQLLWTSFYIHKNPLEANLISDIKDYAWNSCLDYLNINNSGLCAKNILLEQFGSPEKFASHFYESLNPLNTQYKMVGFQDLFIDNDKMSQDAPGTK
jgi:putative transposase